MRRGIVVLYVGIKSGRSAAIKIATKKRYSKKESYSSLKKSYLKKDRKPDPFDVSLLELSTCTIQIN